jgi:excisionase family DNA binding protein
VFSETLRSGFALIPLGSKLAANSKNLAGAIRPNDAPHLSPYLPKLRPRPYGSGVALRVRDWLRWKGVQMKSEDATKTSHYTGRINVMTVREVSAYLRVHPSTIYRLLKHDQIPAFRVGSDWRFNIETIDSWRLAQG